MGRDLAAKKEISKPPRSSIRHKLAKKHPAITEPLRIVRSASIYVREGHYTRAERMLDEFLAENPLHGHAISLMIKLYSKTGRLEKAEELFRKAYKERAADGGVLSSMIAAYSRNGQITKAQQLFDLTLQRLTAVPSAACVLIRAYGKLRLVEQAEDVFGKAASFHDGQIYCTMLSVYCDSRSFGKAEELIGKAEENGYLDPAMFNTLMHAYANRGKLAAARGIFNRAVNKGHCDARLCKTMMHIYIGSRKLPVEERMECAREIFDFACGSGLVNVLMCSILIDRYSRLSRHNLALEIYGAAEKAGVEDLELGMKMLHCYLVNERPNEARQFFQDHFDLLSGEENAYKFVTGAFYDKSRFEDALDFLDSLPEESREMHYVVLRRAEVLRKLRRYDEAIEVSKEALKTKELDMRKTDLALTIIAYSLKEIGKLDEAFLQFDELVRSVPPRKPRYARILAGVVHTCRKMDCDILDAKTMEFIYESLMLFSGEMNRGLGKAVESAIYELELTNPELRKPRRASP